MINFLMFCLVTVVVVVVGVLIIEFLMAILEVIYDIPFYMSQRKLRKQLQEEGLLEK